jgi:hypothetical protein
MHWLLILPCAIQLWAFLLRAVRVAGDSGWFEQSRKKPVLSGILCFPFKPS